MLGTSYFIIFILATLTLFYQRASLIIFSISLSLLWFFGVLLQGLSFGLVVSGVILSFTLFFLHYKPWRRRFITKPAFDFFRQAMPSMSATEKEAIDAGTVTWEADLFRGNPDWHKLLAYPAPALSEEEQAFLAGPVEKLCQMIDDWEITHHLMDLPTEIWDFLKKEGFFGLIIPKQYGGLEFSATAHSQILVKISSCSITASTTVAVPNSLGPAELLLHYGTPGQKEYYLPRLASGSEIPCFALTSEYAGSDASSMIDYGIITHGEFQGEKILGIKLNWSKRYITLAPVATVIGLAFKLYDPDHLLGKVTNIGITCALIPRDTKGVSIGRRHFPLNTPFQNGPITGKDVFIPLDWVIGGKNQLGKGWRMLMDCLAAGRAITLPASSIGGAQLLCYEAGAYARIRKQFNMPIGYFEGVAIPLGRIAGLTYLMDAARLFTVNSIDQGEKPAIASAIVKYHTTEMSRDLSCDALDIHGGKAICLGPKNLLGRGYQSIPIAITVEGANILTRNLIIFGQGVMRCHPYILGELAAAKQIDPEQGLIAFDKLLMQHAGFAVSNAVRSLILGLTSSLLVNAPRVKTKRYFQHASRFSAALAWLSDVAMLYFGGNLKRKESISARFGDILSYLYLLSSVLKRIDEQQYDADTCLVVQYAAEYCLYRIQESFVELFNNLPRNLIFVLIRFTVFPLGLHFKPPSDAIHTKIAKLIMVPSALRSRLSEVASLNRPVVQEIQDALLKTIAAEPIEKIIQKAKHEKSIIGYTLQEQVESAFKNNIINQEQRELVIEAEKARLKVIAVDDFSNEELQLSNFEIPASTHQAHLVG